VFEDLRYGREEVHWHCEWASPDVARAERDALRNRHSHLMWEAARFPRLTVSIGAPL